MGYVIIGNSVAAVGAVEAIRKNDKKGEITIISSEPYFVYSRPLISDFLAGRVKEDEMFYRPKDFYKKNKVKTILGKKATALDTKQRKVILEDKKEISYSKLLIAVGGVPFIPEIKGLDRDGVFTFTALDDAKKIKEYVQRVKRVVIIGGGLIGLKAAESLEELGIRVTVVELMDRVLSAVLDKKSSQIIQKHIIEAGIDIITNNTVKEIIGRDSLISGVILKDEKKMDCEMVLVAIGVVPNLELVRKTKIKVNRGILVNEKMETNIPGIFAAGDVVEAYDLVYQARRLTPIWPDAYRQGSIAGYNMSGIEKRHEGSLLMNAIEFYSLPFTSVGLIEPNSKFNPVSSTGQNSKSRKGKEYTTLTKFNAKQKTYKKIVLKENVIVGAIFVGAIEKAGVITGLIKDKTNVKNFKEELLEDNFGLISFPKELRKEKLRA